tara:strand:+ start:576 stop:1325 length:750 start_codon:yes stop_codon:yes gene_type:complete
MKNKLQNVLITNDDGHKAVGLQILKEIAEELANNVFIISPKFNQSAKSKSITIRKEINFEQLSDLVWVIDGTPTDCVIFALNYLFKEKKPDLILSGINAGSNIGDEVSYSGTVAAAWEGAIRGINSFALSQCGGDNYSQSYEISRTNGLQIINHLINLDSSIPKFYNVNFPYEFLSKADTKNFHFTHLASQKKADELIINMEEKSFTIGRMLNHSQSTLSSDLETIKQNKISISPLLLNLTNENFLNNN